MKNCYLVAAKLDQGDRPFDVDVAGIYPETFELVRGHVWVVSAPPGTGALEVAEALGLGTGGNESASGIVVPAVGYWGFADKELWDLLDAPRRSAGMEART